MIYFSQTEVVPYFIKDQSSLMSVKIEGSMEQTDPFPTFHPALPGQYNPVRIYASSF